VAHRYDLEAAREEGRRAAEAERDEVVDRFNAYGLEMQRRQDEIIDRVKRELRLKLQEVLARAEAAERDRDRESLKVQEIKEMQE
jgi:hypothetical protein